MDNRPRGCLVDGYFLFFIIGGALINVSGINRGVYFLTNTLNLRISPSIKELISYLAVVAGGVVGGLVATYLRNNLPNKDE